MRATVRQVLVTLGLMGAASTATQAQYAMPASDQGDIKQVLEQYLEGLATRDGSRVRQAFHPESSLFWTEGDALVQRTGKDLATDAPRGPAANGQPRRWVEMIEVSGGAAVAKVISDSPSEILTSYFTLLKIGGQWKVMNKVFSREQKMGS